MRINEQGRSMIEMLGVLAIVGVLSVGGIAGYSKAMNKFKTNKAIDQINMMSTNVRTLYSSQKTYGGLINKVAIRTGVIPNEMYSDTSTSTMNNAFGGEAQISAATHVMEDDSFVIAIDKIPAASCVSIATTEWGGDSGSGLVAMAILSGGKIDEVTNMLSGKTKEDDGTGSSDPDEEIKDNASSGYVATVSQLPISVVAAGSYCVGDENAIAWKYL